MCWNNNGNWNIDFCCDILTGCEIAGSEFRGKSINPWIHPASCWWYSNDQVLMIANVFVDEFALSNVNSNLKNKQKKIFETWSHLSVP